MDREPESQPDQTQTRGWIGWIQIGAILGVIVVAMMITAALSAGGGSRGPSAAPERPATPVRVIQPMIGDHAVQLTLTGSVTPPASVSITPQVGGRVVALSQAARAGSAFMPDQVLFEIDPRDYQVAVSRAQAALAEAESARDQLEAEAEINRAEWARQYPDREITPLAAREPQLLAARARVEAAQADLAQARLNLERTRIAFPFSGRVTESRIEAGQLVSAGQSYGAVYDADALEIVAPIAPADLARLDGAVDRAASLTVSETGQQIAATVAREGAALNPRTRFIDLYLRPETPGVLRPGQFVDVTLDGPALEGVMTLPARALIGLDTVLVVRNGQIEPQMVQVLDRPRGAVIVTPFDPAQGVIVTPVPDTAIGRPADILPDRETDA